MNIFRKPREVAPARRQRPSGVSSVRASEADLETRYAFRRNRTLTGSLSSEVESARVRHMELRSARVQGHDLRAHRRRLAAVLGGVLLVVAGLGFAIYDSIAFPVVAITTQAPLDQSLYTGKIQDYLSKHPSQRLRIGLNTRELASFLQTHGAPEVESVNERTDFAGFGKSRITLVMRKPVVVWHTGSRIYFVDSTGNAFERNYYAPPTVEVIDKTGIQTSDNQVLASNRFLGFIGKIIGRMEREGMTVSQVTLPANTTRQVLMTLEGVAYPIKCSVDRSAGEQAEDTVRAVRHLSNKGISPQYLDVRVSGKAYYQ